MKISIKVAALAMLAAASGGAHASSSVVAGIGWRDMGGKQWERLDVDRQAAVSVLADIQISGTPLYVNISGLLSAKDFDAPELDVYDAALAVFDLSAGLKWMPDTGTLKPYLAGGLTSTGVALSYEDQDYDDHDDDDQSFGYYLGTGLQLRISPHLVGGLDLRWVLGTDKVELDGLREDLDSFVAQLSFGYAWGE